MPTYLTPADAFVQSSKRVVLDVRSPGEYAQGHCLEATSLPLFTDAERAEVGTIYKQVDPDQAFLRGLEIAGAKMRSYVEMARVVAPDQEVLLYCWRGGQRSGSMAWLLERAGFKVSVVTGGYKALRKYGKSYLANLGSRLRVLGGATGSGKTAILQALARRGANVLDLEGLANHQGSAFGSLGQGEQPSNEQFENDLLGAALSLPHDDSPIWVEDESRGIGKVYLPEAFYNAMQDAPFYQLTIPAKVRLTRLVADYGRHPVAELQQTFDLIRKRMGGQHVKAAHQALAVGDIAEAARLALAYYDRAYAHGMKKREGKVTAVVEAATFDAAILAARLEALLD